MTINKGVNSTLHQRKLLCAMAFQVREWLAIYRKSTLMIKKEGIPEFLIKIEPLLEPLVEIKTVKKSD